MKRRAKLADSNMEFHGFFQLRRDATGAWNVFNFLNVSYLPRTATAKINQNQKKRTCFIFLVFFHPFERFLEADRLFKSVWNAIFRVPSLEIFKNPWPVFISRLGDNFGGALVFSQMGGKWKINFPPPRVPRNGGGISPPGVREMGGEYLKNFRRLRRAIQKTRFLWGFVVVSSDKLPYFRRFSPRTRYLRVSKRFAVY